MAAACEFRLGLSRFLDTGLGYDVVHRSAFIGMPGVEHGVVGFSAVCCAGSVDRFLHSAEAKSKCDSDADFCFGIPIGAHTGIECDSVGGAPLVRSFRNVDQV